MKYKCLLCEQTCEEDEEWIVFGVNGLHRKCVEHIETAFLHEPVDFDIEKELKSRQDRAEKAEAIRDIFYSHIQLLNKVLDRFCPLVVRAIDMIRNDYENYTFKSSLTEALDAVTEAQNRAYRMPDGKDFLDTSRVSNLPENPDSQKEESEE